jgi:protein-S-isoprenylcysteine O-methyltransferase Ste14
MVGFLLQWPTLPTLVMFPILVVVYRRLAIREERDVAAAFGSDWDAYAARTPRFIARLDRKRRVVPTDSNRGANPVGPHTPRP